MDNYQDQPQYIVVERPSNSLGTAAFVLSLIAFLSAGCLSPISLILSIAAMGRQPKDLAVAGLVLSLIGCIPFAALAIWMLMIAGIFAAAGAPNADGGDPVEVDVQFRWRPEEVPDLSPGPVGVPEKAIDPE